MAFRETMCSGIPRSRIRFSTSPAITACIPITLLLAPTPGFTRSKGSITPIRKGEGNLSRDGRYYAVACRVYNYKTQHTENKKLEILDISARKVISRLSLPSNLADFDWVSVSPSGNFVVADYSDTETGRFHGVEVYDRDFKPLWQKPLGLGHSDLGIDRNGDDVLVIGGYDGKTSTTYVDSYRPQRRP